MKASCRATAALGNHAQRPSQPSFRSPSFVFAQGARDGTFHAEPVQEAMSMRVVTEPLSSLRRFRMSARQSSPTAGKARQLNCE